MKKELDDLLCNRYPKIFVDRHNEKSCMNRGFECDDGWFLLIDQLCSAIQFHVEWKKIEQVIATQMKEKFGGLTFYHKNGDDFVDGLINMAHVISLKTCEVCGYCSGCVIRKKNQHGYIKTLCPDCSLNLGFTDIFKKELTWI